MSRKLTIEFVKESFESEGYKLLSTEYKNNRTKLEYECGRGHRHSISWGSWQQQHKCPHCAGVMKYTIKDIKERLEKEEYRLLSTEYDGVFSKLEYECPRGHIRSITWHDWINGCRCSACKSISIRNKLRKNFDEVEKSFIKEGYVLLSEEYKDSHTKLDCICPKGHKYNITWNSWQQGARCKHCSDKPEYNIEYIKQRFEEENYVLLSKEYKNNKTKLEYICPKGHHETMSWYGWNKGSKCLTCYNNSISNQGSKFWKGGVRKLNLPLYDTYASKVNFSEEVRPHYDDNGRKLLEVRCSKCNKWIIPTIDKVSNRSKALNNVGCGEHRFYCSQECKNSCSIYGKKAINYINLNKSKDFVYTQEELSTWSQEVLKRASYNCEICGEPAEHAHHIQPKKLEPGLALDPDNGLALCKACHYEKGHNKECSTGKLANTVCK